MSKQLAVVAASMFILVGAMSLKSAVTSKDNGPVVVALNGGAPTPPTPKQWRLNGGAPTPPTPKQWRLNGGAPTPPTPKQWRLNGGAPTPPTPKDWK